jgi:hypothetical protein
MSLIQIAGVGGIGSLVIDAPESSLDAVFVKRAAEVLSKFAKPSEGNRLAITSNLVEGRLIPELLTMSAPPTKRLSHLVDLFEIAEPTAAIRELRGEYQAIMDNLVGSIQQTRQKPVARRRR